MILAALLLSCAPDPCSDACRLVARQLHRCMNNDGWSLTWQDLGATSRADFRENCQDAWDLAQADLETRQSDAADEACEVVSQDVTSLSCDELRALYVQ